MKSGKKIFVVVSIVALLAALIFAVKKSSEIYLKKNHSTLAGTFFVLIAPPPDLYSVIWSGHVQRGSVKEIELTFKYAGGHAIQLVGGAGQEDMKGYLECESWRGDLGF